MIFLGKKIIFISISDVVYYNMDELETGLILKDIGNFSMVEFDGRLILQKTVYVLKIFGIDLGYEYKWHLHGAYSSQLAKVGYELKDDINKIPKIKGKLFEDDEIQAKYNKFLEFIKDKKHDACLLEICASICYLNRMTFTREEVLKMVENKKPNFTKEQCVKMWTELEKYGVLNI